ncbi:phosphotransferase enzyme family protein [Sutcliffiella horikoshii]|uniref:phosphotransferase enzyme family protein n=1 Tax=Sutcliffiella horikoshii TaxID=79883 RepID=UPI001F1C23AF|nr:phosphotransferase [Sutcliffiella horikoshii]MCG1020790.1 homoserine kinase [Sutcliffiella horikoshii]
MFKSQDPIIGDILQTLSPNFLDRIIDITPINRGYLNLKWKVTTQKGTYLIKQFNKERLKKYDPDDLLYALKQQKRLNDLDFPCPNIYFDMETPLWQSDGGELFMVMEFCPGETKPYGNLNREEMYHFGKSTGRMHAMLNEDAAGKKMSAEFIPPSLEQRTAHWLKVEEMANSKGKKDLLPLIKKQRLLTEQMDLNKLGLADTGWAHRDLFLDNILFHEGRVSAILDFDRLRYDYPKLDVARAVISSALSNNYFNVELVSSYMGGYKEEITCNDSFLIEGLRLLWYMESTWWIDAEMDKHVGPPIRFLEEMKWLQENYFELEAILID